MSITLSTSIKELNKVGASTARLLRLIGVEVVEDLLFYYPFRYDDFTQVTPIIALRPGMVTNVVGFVELIQNKRSPVKRMNITEALISDDTGMVKVIWFNQPFISKSVSIGSKLSISGNVDNDYSGPLFKSPSFEIVGNGGGTNTQGLVPNYHLTQGLTQKQLRFLINQILHLSDNFHDWLPWEIIERSGLLPLPEAIKKIHFPKVKSDLTEAKKRLSFNELFLIQLQSQAIAIESKEYLAPIIKFKQEETKSFVDKIGFTLTNDQKKAAWQIIQDLESDKPMMRLLEGDVGSGKTITAIIAMYNVALNDHQAVLMVPTEILAHQHFNNIVKMLAPYNIDVALVTSKESKVISSNEEVNKKNDVLKLISEGTVKVIIGTHALIQTAVEFKNLSLAIIDEQHRFGVEQRKKLIEKSGDDKTMPHLLSMTATPIPRSLALAIYGDLDVSIIKEMPKGRKKILTQVIPEEGRSFAYRFIKEEIDKGRQVFVVCPLIDISDKLGVKSVKEEYRKLNEEVFPELKIEMLHGKMKKEEKIEIMKDFVSNKINILVSTSVIEVGVDVPNSTIMLIEGSERFGLSQLHQFRGRVGRGEHQSYCFLFTDSNQDVVLTRLNVLADCNDGFALAQADLKLRGPGEVYGTMQKGFPELKIASLFDYDLMKLAKNEVSQLFTQDKSLSTWPELKEKSEEMKKAVHLE